MSEDIPPSSAIPNIELAYLSYCLGDSRRSLHAKQTSDDGISTLTLKPVCQDPFITRI